MRDDFVFVLKQKYKLKVMLLLLNYSINIDSYIIIKKCVYKLDFFNLVLLIVFSMKKIEKFVK